MGWLAWPQAGLEVRSKYHLQVLDIYRDIFKSNHRSWVLVVNWFKHNINFTFCIRLECSGMLVLAPDGVAHQWPHTRVTRLGSPVNADWLGVTPYTCMLLHQSQIQIFYAKSCNLSHTRSRYLWIGEKAVIDRKTKLMWGGKPSVLFQNRRFSKALFFLEKPSFFVSKLKEIQIVQFD